MVKIERDDRDPVRQQVASRLGRACDRDGFVGPRCPEAHSSGACHLATVAAATPRNCLGQSRIFLPCGACIVACLPRDHVSALGEASSSRRGDRGTRVGAGVHAAHTPGDRNVQAFRLAAGSTRSVDRSGEGEGTVFRKELLPPVGADLALGSRNAGDACCRDPGAACPASRRGLVQRDTANVRVRARLLDLPRRSDRRLPRVATRATSPMPPA